MSSTARQSLINRTAVTLSAVMLIAIINMLVTFLIAESSENDAVRINLAGSLRMQSYRIAEALLIQADTGLNPAGADLLRNRIDEFEDRFYRPVLSSHLRMESHQDLARSFAALESAWEALKLKLENKPRPSVSLLNELDQFVTRVDDLVGKLESVTENKFKLLRLFQGVSLLVTIIIVVFVYMDMSINVVAPLKRLLVVAGKVREGDFSRRIKASGNDELSLLARAFNEMSASLDDMYRGLEKKVQEKTLHLEQAKDGLALLYDISRLLSSSAAIVDRIESSVVKISQYFPDTRIQVDLSADSKTPFVVKGPQQESQSVYVHRYHIPIGREGSLYGEVLVNASEPIEGERWNLLQAFVDNMAAAMNADWQQDQQRRLVLMEERTAIARELHDSLAQSLSYLKIQVSRMQMLKNRGYDSGELDNTVQHIKTGIDTAYGQLRELLATFRLQPSGEGLQSDLEKTVAEFSERGAIEIGLDYGVRNVPLSPNEEIHILQIIREALSNVVRHAGASAATVEVSATEDKRICVRVSDDGCGFGEVDKSTGHYGKTIMQERSRVLGGDVSFASPAEGGATVQLSFTPDVMEDKREQQAS